MKNTRLFNRKQEIKQLALDGRAYRSKNGCGWTPYQEEARFKHIAYCMAKGRDYKQIELKVHEHNIISEYEWEAINKDIEFLKEGFNEDVCISA